MKVHGMLKFHVSSSLTWLSRVLTKSQLEKILKLLLQDFSFYVPLRLTHFNDVNGDCGGK
jgi:hypothetical protein